jgi:hypothetical protein
MSTASRRRSSRSYETAKPNTRRSASTASPRVMSAYGSARRQARLAHPRSRCGRAGTSGSSTSRHHVCGGATVGDRARS